MMNKIAIAGAGRVGEATAQFLAERSLCKELALFDINAGAAKGAALDINEVAPIFGYDITVRGGDDPQLLLGAELVIVTAGVPRKPGMSRSDLLEINVNIADDIIDNVMKFAPNTKLLFVSNPVDVITYYAWRKTGWDRNRIFGQAGVLDSARQAFFISEATGYSVKDINTLVLGGHGDTMVPLTEYTTINGKSIHYFLSPEEIAAIEQRTRDGGAEVLKLRGNSSAFQAPAAAVVDMVDTIVHDRRRITPTVCILDGHYGHTDIAAGVPAILGKHGVERIYALGLSVGESAAFDHSIELIKQDIKLLKEIKDIE
jgi:malate dehydrogenase